MSEIIQISTTTEKQQDARRIAAALVEKRLAACVQVSGPIHSTYWWKESVEQSTEWVCTAKTRRALYPRVEETILELHPYDVPEVIAVDIVAGSQAYLQWVEQQVT